MRVGGEKSLSHIPQPLCRAECNYGRVGVGYEPSNTGGVSGLALRVQGLGLRFRVEPSSPAHTACFIDVTAGAGSPGAHPG